MMNLYDYMRYKPYDIYGLDRPSQVEMEFYKKEEDNDIDFIVDMILDDDLTKEF